MDHQNKNRPCAIVQLGKSRSGAPRWWCQTHSGPATGRYGARLEECESAHLDTKLTDCFALDANAYLGGVGVWGAVDPIYDTSGRKDKPGLHVHARLAPGDKEKKIDKTYDAVSIRARRDLIDDKLIYITQDTAVAYYVSRFLCRNIKYLFCAHCGTIHLDAGYFAVKPHRRHLCHACGRTFVDNERSISNPIAYIRALRDDFLVDRKIIRPNRALDICQSNYPGGMQIWASNPALLWTSKKNEEEGIHVHLYADANSPPVVDETFSTVRVDGFDLDIAQAAQRMAQQTLPYLRNKLVSLVCPSCGAPHFDRGECGFYPHKTHKCESCGVEFTAPGRRRLVVSNPLIPLLESLKQCHGVSIGKTGA